MESVIYKPALPLIAIWAIVNGPISQIILLSSLFPSRFDLWSGKFHNNRLPVRWVISGISAFLLFVTAAFIQAKTVIAGLVLGSLAFVSIIFYNKYIVFMEYNLYKRRHNMIKTMNIICAHNLKKRYPGNFTLDIPYINIDKGSIVGIVGNNGAGKTTLLRLILDEPFNYLDPSSQFTVMSKLRELNKTKGTTIIFSSHNLDYVAELSSRILLMENGSVKGDFISSETNVLILLKEYFHSQYNTASKEKSYK